MAQLNLFVAMCLYLAVVMGIGFLYAKKANASSDNYFLGGRSLGPFVTAMSAEASDMSGWLLLGLPGLAYFTGLSDALWTAIGLGVGTYLNWLLIARRLRIFSHVAGDSITLPDFFSRRFLEKDHKIIFLCAIFILIFFTVYASSCFVTMGKLFSSLFGMNYHLTMVFGAVFVVVYTFLGGFLAESVSDFMQSVVMIIALVVTVGTGLYAAGGIDVVLLHLQSIDGFMDLNLRATATGAGTFGAPQSVSIPDIISTLSWGLGYFGVPQVLLRFMAIRKAEEIRLSRRVATVWVFLSLFVAVWIGLLGRHLFPEALATASESEQVFILMAHRLMPPFAAGIMMAGILAATVSSSDSYLLIAASAFAKNLYQGMVRKDAQDFEIMRVSKITLLIITLLAMALALDEHSVIFTIVSFAWAGFGATFGPLMLASLFWRSATREGALAGLLTGGISVFVWKIFLKPLGGIFGIYELLPAFLLSLFAIIVVSHMTKKDPEVLALYDKYKESL